MPFYRQLGDVPRKRHTQHHRADGGLYNEELTGEEGFSDASALLYHRNIPSAIIASTLWVNPSLATTPNHPLRPRHLRLHDLFAGSEWHDIDVVTGRRLILGNEDVFISYVVAGRPSPLYRSGIGDECVYIESGKASVETVFGDLEVGQGDYVVLPRGTTHRWLPTSVDPLRAYCIEASSHIGPPKRYLSRGGQFLEHAPYCERDLRAPNGPRLVEGGDVDVYLKHRGRGPGGVVGSVLTYPTHPFDVVGWDGCLYPYAFNISDFEPITGRIHQPPPVHQVLEGHNFVICNFVPRKVDYHPDAVPTPYYHANVDSDEVMFYVAGDYAARRGSGIGIGSISLHPGGHSHGPQPGAVEASLGRDFVDELAVMLDTFRPLELGDAGLACEDPNYAWSWAGGRHARSSD
jgi:homogentisate 1,2-dioxygenase